MPSKNSYIPSNNDFINALREVLGLEPMFSAPAEHGTSYLQAYGAMQCTALDVTHGYIHVFAMDVAVDGSITNETN